MLNRAIQSHDKNDWGQHRNKKSLLNNEIKKLKSKYLKSKLTEKNNNWKFLKSYNKQEKSAPPSTLSVRGYIFNKPRDIANLMNNFFISKIEQIRQTFTDEEIGPIEILQKLIPRVENEIDIPLITIQQTINLINKAKNSNSSGYDDINMKFLKKCKIKLAPHITQMINTILITKIP